MHCVQKMMVGFLEALSVDNKWCHIEFYTITFLHSKEQPPFSTPVQYFGIFPFIWSFPVCNILWKLDWQG